MLICTVEHLSATADDHAQWLIASGRLGRESYLHVCEKLSIEPLKESTIQTAESTSSRGLKKGRPPHAIGGLAEYRALRSF